MTLTSRLLLSAAVLVLAGCDDAPEQASEGPPPGVLVAPVKTLALADRIEYVGKTVAVNDASLSAQVEGYLLERQFTEGQDVQVGDALFVIDPGVYEAVVAAARGEVAEVKAALKRANQDVERQRGLAKQQAASVQRVEEAEASKLQAEAKLLSAEARLQRAEIDLGHTIIKAPFDGRIGRALQSVGDLVTPASGDLARLVELDPMYVNFSVSESSVIRLKRELTTEDGAAALEALRVSIRLPDGTMYDQPGRIDFLDNAVDRKTGTLIVRARFDNPERLLVPGLFVRTVIESAETADELVIPQAAIQEDQAGKFVMVVGPDEKVELRRIRTGRAQAGLLVVREGLEPDERVIVEGVQKVRPGIVVEAKVAPNPLQSEAEESSPDAPPAGDEARPAADGDKSAEG